MVQTTYIKRISILDSHTLCKNAMKFWGYNIANNEEEYKNLNPLNAFTLDSDKRADYQTKGNTR